MRQKQHHLPSLSPPDDAPHFASSLITACTNHIRDLSKLSDKRPTYHYRAPLCHEFGRFRLWTHGFDNTPPADGNILDELLEEAVYLKEPTLLLLASFARCLLDDCLRKVGNDYTRALLRLSLSNVTGAYPRCDDALKRQWATPDAAIGELRECVDALFDLVSTLDSVMEKMKEDHVVAAAVANPVEPLTAGTNAPRTGTGCAASPELSAPGLRQGIQGGIEIQCPLPTVGVNSSTEGESVGMQAGSLERQPPPNICGFPSIGWDEEVDQYALEKAFSEEPAARPVSMTGSHWEIYRQYIRDRFPEAIPELDIDGLAKGNVECYNRLMRLDGDKRKDGQLVPDAVGQSAQLPSVLEQSAMYAQTGQQMLERMKELPSAGVPTIFKDSGLGSSAPHNLPPATTVYAPDQLVAVALSQPTTVPAANMFLASPPSVSGLSQSTICSVSSEPSNRRLLPRVPEHSRYGTGFECTFCGLNQHPTTHGHRWRKHVFADLAPYMCLRAGCPRSGSFFSSKKAWVAHDISCMQYTGKSGGGPPVTSQCPFCLKGFGVNAGRLYSHIAHHLEDIRLFALPPALREYGAGEYEGNSEASSIVSGEDRSALAVYAAENRAADGRGTMEWTMQAEVDNPSQPGRTTPFRLVTSVSSDRAGPEVAPVASSSILELESWEAGSSDILGHGPVLAEQDVESQRAFHPPTLEPALVPTVSAGEERGADSPFIEDPSLYGSPLTGGKTMDESAGHLSLIASYSAEKTEAMDRGSNVGDEIDRVRERQLESMSRLESLYQMPFAPSLAQVRELEPSERASSSRAALQSPTTLTTSTVGPSVVAPSLLDLAPPDDAVVRSKPEEQAGAGNEGNSRLEREHAELLRIAASGESLESIDRRRLLGERRGVRR